MTDGGPETSPGSRRAPLGSLVVVLCAVNVIVALDFLGASVLLAPIGHDLHLSTADLAWVVNGYLLTLAAPLIAAGRAADTYGPIRLTRLGLVGFAAGALMTGAANSAEVLVAGRMVQGLGASVLAATGLTLVNAAAPVGDRGRVVGIWAGVGAVGSAAGPLVAGLIEAASVWRVFFLIDVPVALIVAWLLRREHDAPRPARREAVGLRPASWLTVGLGLLVFAVLAGPETGWGSGWVFGPALGGVALLVAFGIDQRHRDDPLIPVRLLRGPGYGAVAVTAWMGNAAFAVVAFFASLYLQQVQGLDPVVAGAVFLAMTIPLMVCSPIAGAWTRRFAGSRLMAVGLVIVGVSVAMFARLGTDDGVLVLVVALVVAGIGQALVFNVSNVAAMAGASGAAGGVASGVINEIRQLGALVGLAVISGLFAALQARASGTAAEAFVSALRFPSLVLAAGCVVAAVYVGVRGAPGLVDARDRDK
ncbi:MAG: MFS transporter [Acidimicrobiia bacterium]|nr:MFS transporter [Acidimicrobiia bacterium]